MAELNMVNSGFMFSHVSQQDYKSHFPEQQIQNHLI